jgi:hypothetical protein
MRVDDVCWSLYLSLVMVCKCVGVGGFVRVCVRGEWGVPTIAE